MLIQKKSTKEIQSGDIIIVDIFDLKCSKLDIFFDIENSVHFDNQDQFEIFVCGVKEAPIFLFEVTEKDITRIKNEVYIELGCAWNSRIQLPNLMVNQEYNNYILFDVIVSPFKTIPCYIDTIYGGNPNMTAEGFHNNS